MLSAGEMRALPPGEQLSALWPPQLTPLALPRSTHRAPRMKQSRPHGGDERAQSSHVSTGVSPQIIVPLLRSTTADVNHPIKNTSILDPI